MAKAIKLVEKTLFNWIGASRQCQINRVDCKQTGAEEMEIASLRTEPAQVKMDRDILGKSMA